MGRVLLYRILCLQHKIWHNHLVCIVPSIFSMVHFLSRLDAVFTFMLGDPELTVQPFGHVRLSLFFADTTSWTRNRTLPSATPFHLSFPPVVSSNEPSMTLKVRTSAPYHFLGPLWQFKNAFSLWILSRQNLQQAFDLLSKSKITHRKKLESNLVLNDIVLIESTWGVQQKGKLRKVSGNGVFYSSQRSVPRTERIPDVST